MTNVTSAPGLGFVTGTGIGTGGFESRPKLRRGTGTGSGTGGKIDESGTGDVGYGRDICQ